ncbi:TetR/AcrR family transcriptional regulator [Metabacillus malikii]|uniref:AcrR family transcriptional regulator n=1 Tax=Metabacillus malikii TaxID=1504265 RepID=A0ABT9ZF17_9BACI|nr:TetR/AcrR family transcriptional regulator [Metabacillus malikii]MDQ0230163.1 AcrR family transcriptional regulator [Metabacillus malikii]
MTSDKIKQKAQTLFTSHGYDAASLALIANEVGIKKQSIYTHFKSKEELFLQIFTESVEHELSFVKSYLERNKSLSLHDILNMFLNEYLNRYEKNANTRFFLKTSFFPPFRLEKNVKLGSEKFVNELELIILSLFQYHSTVLNSDISPETASLAYLTMLDGLFVELLYGIPERLTKRKTESWNVYWQGISMNKGELR